MPLTALCGSVSGEAVLELAVKMAPPLENRIRSTGGGKAERCETPPWWRLFFCKLQSPHVIRPAPHFFLLKTNPMNFFLTSVVYLCKCFVPSVLANDIKLEMIV